MLVLDDLAMKLEVTWSFNRSLFKSLSFSSDCKLMWASLVLILLALCATHKEDNMNNSTDIFNMEFQLKMSFASLTLALSPLTPFCPLPLSCCFHKKRHAHCTHVHVHALGKQLWHRHTHTHQPLQSWAATVQQRLLTQSFSALAGEQWNSSQDTFYASLCVSAASGAFCSSPLRVKMPRNQEITSVEMKGPSSRQVTESLTMACQCFTARLNVFSVGRPAWCHRQLPRHPLQGDSGEKLPVSEEGHCERYPHQPQVSTNLPPRLFLHVHTVTGNVSC